jgi:hypothetical protein
MKNDLDKNFPSKLFNGDGEILFMFVCSFTSFINFSFFLSHCRLQGGEAGGIRGEKLWEFIRGLGGWESLEVS